jgi:hypothetical protein
MAIDPIAEACTAGARQQRATVLTASTIRGKGSGAKWVPSGSA